MIPTQAGQSPNVIKLRNCNPAPVIFEQAFGARFFAALENDSPKRAAKDLGGGGASCFLNLMIYWSETTRSFFKFFAPFMKLLENFGVYKGEDKR